MLVLHIGLPKTATTFLQHKILKRADGLQFIHRITGRRAAGLCLALKRAAAAHDDAEAATYRRRVTRLLGRLTEPAPDCVLVSDENVSVHPADFWTGTGADPKLVARRLRRLGRGLDPPLAGLRVIVGIRRQDQWLGSRYAESAKLFPGFGQADFDRRMRAVAEAPELAGPLGWLDFAAMRKTFGRAIGADNLLIVPMERLTEAPRETLAEMGGFLGGIDLVHRYDRAEARGDGLRRNTLSAGENTWRLRSGEDAITLDPGVQAALRARFAAANAALAANTPLGFEP
jgi:hypothetical protein